MSSSYKYIVFSSDSLLLGNVVAKSCPTLLKYTEKCKAKGLNYINHFFEYNFKNVIATSYIAEPFHAVKALLTCSEGTATSIVL